VAVQAEIDHGERPGVTSEENAQIRELKARVKRLEEDNEILRRASIFFAGELDPRNR
jgi:transposase